MNPQKPVRCAPPRPAMFGFRVLHFKFKQVENTLVVRHKLQRGVIRRKLSAYELYMSHDINLIWIIAG